jgi:hypothetical protein
VRLWAEDALAKNEALPTRTMDELKDDPGITEQLNEGAVFALIPLHSRSWALRPSQSLA